MRAIIAEVFSAVRCFRDQSLDDEPEKAANLVACLTR